MASKVSMSFVDLLLIFLEDVVYGKFKAPSLLPRCPRMTEVC